MGCDFFLQGIFLTKGSNPHLLHLLHWRKILYHWATWEAPEGKIMAIYNKSTACVRDGEGDGTPLQYSCLENPMDGGAWQAAAHGVVKSRTWLNNFPFTFHFHALEKEMATHSSVLAWRIPGTGESGGLPSMGSHRVGHNWSDSRDVSEKQNIINSVETINREDLLFSHFCFKSKFRILR